MGVATFWGLHPHGLSAHSQLTVGHQHHLRGLYLLCLGQRILTNGQSQPDITGYQQLGPPLAAEAQKDLALLPELDLHVLHYGLIFANYCLPCYGRMTQEPDSTQGIKNSFRPGETLKPG